MPKIFGEDFYAVDFERSVVALRLDDMPKGESLAFAFLPWPKGYQPRPQEAQITSVHVNFIANKPRIGFRFDVSHRESRFSLTQDEIDDIRSKSYRRKSEDQLFLDPARQRLLDSFTGKPEAMRILAVNLGSSAAAAALFEGRVFVGSYPLKIAKLGRLMASFKDGRSSDSHEHKSGKHNPSGRRLGVEHVNLHGNEFAIEASTIARKRLELRAKEVTKNGDATQPMPVTLGGNDLRGLTLHVRRMIRDWVRLNAKQIIDVAERERADLIVFESMRGFCRPVTTNSIHSWQKRSDGSHTSPMAQFDAKLQKRRWNVECVSSPRRACIPLNSAVRAVIGKWKPKSGRKTNGINPFPANAKIANIMNRKSTAMKMQRGSLAACFGAK